MTTDIIEFDMPKNQSSIIKVLGVGGGGSNAVNHMFRQGIEGVDFIVCNTDSQALDQSPVPNKIQLGIGLTDGRGAGSIPEVGKNAALEDLDRIKETLATNTKMVFITAGMGGGTGTGAAPVIARAAKEMGILTVAIVTVPFSFEGRKRRQQAEDGIRALSESVDTILVIRNDRLRELYGNLSITEAFAKADNVLTTGAKGIAEIITLTGNINVDFADVRTVMSDSGVAIMGNGMAEGENRALKAIETALSSPLLNDNQIVGAKNILLNITSGIEEILMDEITEITDHIQAEAGDSAEIIWGLSNDENLDKKISVTLVATGFVTGSKPTEVREEVKEKKVSVLKEGSSQEKTMEWEGPFDNEKEETHGITLITKTTGESAQERKSALTRENNQTGSHGDPYEDFKKKMEGRGRVKEVGEEPLLSEEAIREEMRTRDVRLKNLSIQIKTPEGLSDLEKQPAFVRRNIPLNPVPSSSESHVSRFTLGESDGKTTQIKSNNSFLHDNVD